VLELFPETKLGHGPADRERFFLRLLQADSFTAEDLEKIEKKMQELCSRISPTRASFCHAIRGWRSSKKKATS